MNHRAHDHVMAGHFALSRTYLKVQDQYYWPGAYSDVQRYIQTCPICQAYSKVRYHEEFRLAYLPSVQFEWYVDLIELPKCRGFRGAVLARKGVTNFVEGRPIRTKGSAGIR